MSQSFPSAATNMWSRVLVLSCIAAAFGLSVRASGEQKGNASGFATVDFKKLVADYKAKDTYESSLKDMQAKYTARLSRRDNMPLLTEQEQQQLDDLYEKPNQTDADKAKIKDLETKAKQQSDEVQALSQKQQKDLTDADKAKLADTGTKMREAQQKYQQLKDTLESQFNRFKDEQQDQLIAKVRTAAAKVAEQKGIAVVYTSDIVLYAGNDITSQVVTELNKTK